MRISDWSSDVCSSDLPDLTARQANYMRMLNIAMARGAPAPDGHRATATDWFDLLDRQAQKDRKRVVYGKSVSVRVDLGGRRIIKKKNKKNTDPQTIMKMRHNDIILTTRNTKPK